jgi:hypothetical protein
MIPDIIHFIFGLKKDFGGKPFSLVHYLAIRSALEVNQPSRICFHYCYEPSGYWWEKIKPELTLNRITLPERIFGNRLHHFAHKADVLRLEVLREQGGIYLDSDTISVRPLKELCLDAGFVIGQQLSHEPFRMRLSRGMRSFNVSSVFQRNKGLCNAVLMAGKGNDFVNRWYDSYRSFRSRGRDEYWDEHSVVVPRQLARMHRKEVKIVSPYHFHYPLYDPGGLRDLFASSATFPQAYVHHLWETFSWEPYLKELSPEKIWNQDTTYNRIARRFLPSPAGATAAADARTADEPEGVRGKFLAGQAPPESAPRAVPGPDRFTGLAGWNQSWLLCQGYDTVEGYFGSGLAAAEVPVIHRLSRNLVLEQRLKIKELKAANNCWLVYYPVNVLRQVRSMLPALLGG